MALDTYRRKRDFGRTPEPKGRRKQRAEGRSFVVHKHAARSLHYDFRLELRGALVSFAVPKGPPRKTGEKRLAVRTEDHPLEYARFEGEIPAGQYGAGKVEIWDQGTWEPEGDAARGLAAGKLDFRLDGERLRGRWSLVRFATGRSRDGRDWLLIKRSDRAQPPVRGAVKRARPPKNGKAAGPPPSFGELPGARRAAQPRSLAPQLCKLASSPPDGEGWLHEIKLDGYRLLAFRERGRVRVLTRRGEDWTARFPGIARALEELAVDAVVDGEVVVLDDTGVSDFQRLQNALKEGGERPVFFAFDLPYAGGFDLTAAPLVERKGALERLLAPLSGSGPVRYCEHVAGSGPLFLAHACELGLEGAISKPAAARYQAGRRAAWIKTKCLKRQELVVGGWSEPAGSRQHLGALLVGYPEGKGDAAELRYAGKVGTGFSEASLRELARRLRPLARAKPPFSDPPRGAAARGAHWVEPRCVVEVAFTEWTADGRLRHPSFAGVREDKRPEDVRRERASAAPSPRVGRARPGPKGRAASTTSAKTAPAEVAGVRLSNASRVLFPELGATKLDLALYYEAVAEHLLPHVAGRPLSVLRCPEGPAAGCFYQKHLTPGFGASVRGFPVREKEGKRDYLGIDDLTGLIQLVQHGAVELHPWGARADKVDKPDRVVLDLDPGPGVDWARVVAAARALREIVLDLGLSAFLRTTGGKGLHVVLPFERRASWDAAKELARELGAALARRDPKSFVLVATKARRGGKIYVDYLRNARGATAVASYSVRARPGAPVATPLAWDELTPRLDPARFDLRGVPRRLKALTEDPWEGFFETRQSLTAALVKRVKAL